MFPADSQDPEGGGAQVESSSSLTESPMSPTSLPKPSPPSPSGMKTPEPRPWADNIYSRKIGDDSVRSVDTDDTLPLGSPWATPGIRREPAVIPPFGVNIQGEESQGEESGPNVSPISAKCIFGEHAAEASESSSLEDDEEISLGDRATWQNYIKN